jgi:hypothetical protein
MNILKTTTLAVLSLGMIATTVTPSFAGTFAQNHPRRAEVLRRDNRLNNKINADKGYLGGHYAQLEREDAGIRRQEQRDARINGGYITQGQQRQLNREENNLNRQINWDNR